MTKRFKKRLRLTRLFRITGPDFVAGLEVSIDEYELVVRTAPILKWLYGDSWWRVKQRLKMKNLTYKEIH